MSTLKSINVQHPSGATTNIVNDASGNVTVGNNLTVTGAASITGNVSGTWNGTAISAAKGGTGLTTLTANNVLLGNGTSALQFVAPGTSGNVLVSNGTTWASSAPASSGITSGTAVASTSGTSIDFTGISATAKRVTVMLNQVSTNGSSIVQIQLGSGSVVTTGYQSDCAFINGGTGQGSATTGHIILYAGLAPYSYIGTVVFTLQSTNTWVGTGISRYQTGGSVAYHTSVVTLSGTLDRVRITTVTGTDTFDAGSINLLWE